MNLMDCSSRNLTSLPSYWPVDAKKIFLDNNGIKTIKRGDFSFKRLPHLTELYFQNNEINTTENGSIDNLHRLKTLWLHNNKLKSINFDIFDNLYLLNVLTLHGNPWECTCEFGPSFQKFITTRLSIISNAKSIYCKYSNLTNANMQSVIKTREVELNQEGMFSQPVLDIDFSFCENISLTRIIHHRSGESLTGLITVTVLFLCIGCLSILVFKQRLLLRVWIYNKFGVHFHRESDDDEDKPYDVFLAHARDDDRFVIGSLLPELECSEAPYKVRNLHFYMYY